MKPGGIVALTAAALAAGTAWHYATRPPGDWWTDAAADQYAQCMPWCASGPPVVKSTTSPDRLTDLEGTSRWDVIQIHHDELSDMSAAFGGYHRAMTACYEVTFNYYGKTGGPRRVDCPQNGTGATP
ncbi:hypothetical protein [Lentzea sp. NPDC051838]|uniref:hypothetical protein n=1 Tax=Lentzea sp. NPDC051838 TaxID=3154849 RepID=UPI0034407CDB